MWTEISRMPRSLIAERIRQYHKEKKTKVPDFVEVPDERR